MRRCDYCSEPLPKGKRLDARFCDSLCRGRYHRGPPSETATNGNPAKSEAPRRLTRDGRGQKVYLLADELSELELGPPYALNVLRKLRSARARITQREENA